MNKTININIGGYFFHIDESAYNKLKKYLDAVSESLDNNQGKTEILNDIEIRISELLSENLTDSRQVINTNQINNVIEIMGQPEDYTESETTNNINNETEVNKPIKKLFRDRNDKFLGGVCSGIAHFIGIDNIWIRLIFLILIASGFSILFYIVLWILVPEARTTAQKLQMKGKPVNINNIEKKIKTDFENLSVSIKNGAEDLSKKVSNLDYDNIKTNTKTGLEEIVDFIANIAVVLFKIFGKILALLLILISGTTIIGLIFGAFSYSSLEFLNVNNESYYPSFLLNSSLPEWLIISMIFIAIFIPMIALFILGLRILSSNIKKTNTFTRLTLLGIWLVSLFIIVFTQVENNVANAFDGTSVSKQSIISNQRKHFDILVKNDNNIFYNRALKKKNNSKTVTIDGKRKKYSNNVGIDIRRSETGDTFIEIIKESKGKQASSAKVNAEKIEYKYEVIDEKIIFDAYFLSNIKNLNKEEEIKVVFYIPINTTIYFQKSSKRFLDDIENTNNIHDLNMSEQTFKMTEDGFECIDCDVEENESNLI